MTNSRRTASTSPAQRITAAIIEKLEQGTKPWVKPWRGVPVSRPLRSCGTPYRGMNTFWLWIVADGCGYASPYWMTYRQCQALGGQVRKGEKSTIAIFYKSYTKEVEDAKGEADTEIRSAVIGTSTTCSSRVTAAPRLTSVVRPRKPASAAKRLRCRR